MRCTTKGCGESWELDSIHERIAELYPNQPWKKPGDKPGYDREQQKRYEEGYFNPALKEFREKGCEYFGASHNIVYVCGDCGAHNREKTDCYNCEGTNLTMLGEPVGPHGLTPSEAQGVLLDEFGDDVDGVEAMMQDEFGW